MTYLIDEGYNVGKGANSIISMLHHFFEVHGLGETSVHLHADNCTSQNKTVYDVLFYVAMHDWVTQSHHHIVPLSGTH